MDFLRTDQYFTGVQTYPLHLPMRRFVERLRFWTVAIRPTDLIEFNAD
ncbi:MAG: hypothetical protein AAF456_16460 [Planctomycetota bacterium]